MVFIALEVALESAFSVLLVVFFFVAVVFFVFSCLAVSRSFAVSFSGYGCTIPRPVYPDKRSVPNHTFLRLNCHCIRRSAASQRQPVQVQLRIPLVAHTPDQQIPPCQRVKLQLRQQPEPLNLTG